MTDYAFTINGEPIQFRADDHFRADVNGVETWHPRAALTIWSDDERAAFGIIRTEVPAPVMSQAKALKALADRRWWKTQTFIYDGVETQADGAIAVVNATLALRQRRGVPSDYPQTWKLGASEFRQWDEAQIEAFGFAIADHIQACFEREAELTALIIAAEDPSSVDTSTGWPG